MKIAYCFTCFLIAGILNVTVGQTNSLDQSCMENGGRQAYEEFQNSMKNIAECSNTVMAECTMKYKETNKMHDGFALYCNKIPTLKNCIKRFINAVKPCVPEEQRETMDSLYKIAASGLQFVCDSSDMIEKAINSPDTDCIPTKMQAMMNCVYKLITGGRNDMAINTGPGAHPINALSTLKMTYDPQGCSNLMNMEQCTVRVMDECNDKTFSNVLDSFYRHINNEISCENLPKSKASTTKVFNVMLSIIAGITMFL